eukprot:2508693-Amphidinium_carterae.2
MKGQSGTLGPPQPRRRTCRSNGVCEANSQSMVPTICSLDTASTFSVLECVNAHDVRTTHHFFKHGQSTTCPGPHSDLMRSMIGRDSPESADPSKNFECPFCSWTFKSPTARYLHLGVQHSAIQPLLQGKPQHATNGQKLFLIPVTTQSADGQIGWSGATEKAAYKTVLANLSKLDSAAMRQVTSLTEVPHADELPPPNRVTQIPEQLLCSYDGSDAIKIRHSGAIVYHKQQQQQRDHGTSSWSKPWNTCIFDIFRSGLMYSTHFSEIS